MSEHTAPAGVPTTRTARLLACGVVAGPLFVATVLIQALTRDGFDPTRHPLSLLSLGGAGWIQITNFVLTGVLCLAGAAGVRRVLRPGRGGTWGPLLIGGVGVGMIVSGVSVTDAGAGFPPGAPAGAPEMSWHGALHEVGFLLAIVGLVAACLVVVRRFAALHRRDWVGAGVAAVVSAVAVTLWPDLDSLSARLLIATAILFGFVAALAARLARGLPEAGHAARGRETRAASG